MMTSHSNQITSSYSPIFLGVSRRLLPVHRGSELSALWSSSLVYRKSGDGRSQSRDVLRVRVLLDGG
jgi:hypothetical protein